MKIDGLVGESLWTRIVNLVETGPDDRKRPETAPLTALTLVGHERSRLLFPERRIEVEVDSVEVHSRIENM